MWAGAHGVPEAARRSEASHRLQGVPRLEAALHHSLQRISSAISHAPSGKGLILTPPAIFKIKPSQKDSTHPSAISTRGQESGFS